VDGRDLLRVFEARRDEQFRLGVQGRVVIPAI
jgi:hypothetical protein